MSPLAPGVPLHAGTATVRLVLLAGVHVAPSCGERCGRAPCHGSAEQMSPSLSLRAFHSCSFVALSGSRVGSAS